MPAGARIFRDAQLPCIFRFLCVTVFMPLPMYAQGAEQIPAARLTARAEFRDAKLGMFIHWSVDAQLAAGEWVMNTGHIALTHRLQPSALIIPDHHKAPGPGEDVQTFEQDQRGANTTGFRASRAVSSLPLETSLTMNNAWGLNITDTRFKPVRELIG